MYRLKHKYNETLLTDWTFTLSDHCLLQLTFKPELRQPTRRIVSLPTYILDIKEEVEQIEKGMTEFVEMISEHWTASLRLEFLKTSLRTVVGECIKDRNWKEKIELEKIQRELELKMTRRGTIPLYALEKRQEDIDRLFLQRNSILEKKSEALATKAKTKWFHEGERSNKFFLNLLRRRNAVTEIESLETEDGLIRDRTKIQGELRAFYTNLYENGMQSEIDSTFYQNITKVPVAEANYVKLDSYGSLRQLFSCINI
jgi:hypothetical protein